MARAGSSVMAALLSATCALLVFVLTIYAQTRADASRAEIEDQLLYLPNERLLGHFTGGMDSIIANMIWLKCVQYTATEAKGPRDFTWLQHMIQTVVRLDPYFVDAYRFGAMFLAALKADDSAALDLLEAGMLKNPTAWELPYEAAMVYLLNRRERPEARQQAAFYLTLSVGTGNAPRRVMDLASKLSEEADLGEIEHEMWSNLLESPDEFLREMAARKLQELRLREAVSILNERLAHFAQGAGAPAESLEQLVEVGLLTALPPDPLGGHFFIAADGRAYSTSLLDERKNQHASIIRNALQRYRDAYGAWPDTLDTLVTAGMLTELPRNPYPGAAWEYNPALGTLK